MKRHSIGIVLIAVTLHLGVARSQTQSSKDGPTTPLAEHHGGYLFVDVIPVPQSLKQLADMSTLIIEGVVAKVMPPRTDRQVTETDSVITVAQILKGSDAGPEIVISQLGAGEESTQYSIVKVGERYIFCLEADDRTTVPPVAGLKRYNVTAAWSGLLLVGADDLVHTDPKYKDVLRKKYEGTSKAAMIDLLKQAINQK